MTPTGAEGSKQFLNEWLQESADAQPMTAKCALCPEWEHSGPAVAARAAAEDHRKKEHPELVATKRGVIRKKRVWSSTLTAEREAEIEEERRQRMRAMGLA